MIQYLISYSIFFIIGYFSTNYWVKKRNIDKPFYYSIIINAVMILILILMNFLPFFPANLLVAYFIDAIVGAFLISTLFKQNFVQSLRFSSWYLFWIMLGVYFILLSLGLFIGGIWSFFV
ncbi:MAG: hypothetical protein EAX89_05180 [Candidatus Lokiarchaeota archaeon]|nr:hypothetical protein [Candidatus Lokiarchaeota archaeon]